MLTIYSWFDFIPISTLLVADNKEEDTKSVSFFICDLGWFFVVFPAVFYSVSAPTGPMFFSIWICFCSNIVSSHLQMFLTWKTPHNVPFISLRTSVIWSQIATCSVCDSLSITVLQMRELYGFLHDTTHLSYHALRTSAILPHTAIEESDGGQDRIQIWRAASTFVWVSHSICTSKSADFAAKITRI